jgi:hypothetical protein
LHARSPLYRLQKPKRRCRPAPPMTILCRKPKIPVCIPGLGRISLPRTKPTSSLGFPPRHQTTKSIAPERFPRNTSARRHRPSLWKSVLAVLAVTARGDAWDPGSLMTEYPTSARTPSTALQIHVRFLWLTLDHPAPKISTPKAGAIPAGLALLGLGRSGAKSIRGHQSASFGSRWQDLLTAGSPDVMEPTAR